MKTFIDYISTLLESADESQLSHLYHNEEHIFNHGKDGYDHAHANLKAVHDSLSGHKVPGLKVTQKIDGSPSIIAGYHPVNKKFFVATKSAFNKEPKINYSHEDIDKNHGHALGLVSKLKSAIEHLPKVMPTSGIYQGDVIHTHEDKVHSEHGVSFKPNTINYTVSKNHPDHPKVVNSKFGVAFHTKYEGIPDSDHHIGGMHATFDVKHNKFGSHADVHLLSPEVNHTKVPYSDSHKKAVADHLDAADRIHKHISPGDYDAVSHHADYVRKYFNAKVRDGGIPNVDDYHSYTHNGMKAASSKMKSAKGKAARDAEAATFDNHVKLNRGSFEKVFNAHDHLQHAKDAIVHALSSNPEYGHSVNGKEVKPEGFVAIRGGRPTKLVDRKEFSRLNFENNRGRV